MMTVSTKPMPNMATTVRAVVVAVLALALALAGQPRAASAPAPAAALDAGFNYATFQVSNGDFPIVPGAVEQLGLWWKCEGSAHWSGAGSNNPPDVFAPVLYLNGYCERGFSMGDETLKVKAESSGCGDWTGTFGNIDQANMRPFNNVELVNSWEDYNEGAGCQPIIELCFQDESFFTGDYAQGDWRCVPLGLIPPPPMEQPVAGDGGGCPYTSGVPASPTYEVTGGSTRQWRMVGTADVTTSLTGTLAIQGVWRSTVTNEYRVGPRPEGASTANFISISGTGLKTVTSVEQKTGWTTATSLHEWKLIGISLYLTGGTITSYSSAQHNALNGPTMGITNGAQCKWYWGENFRADNPVSSYIPAGPGGNLDGPIGAPEYEPPTVDVLDDCTASTADVCVEHPDPPPGQMPDPDSEECDLSAWDPTTYPQQVECGLARVVQVVVVTQVAILNTLQEILTLIGNLFLPPEDLWPDLWGRFEQEWEDSTLDDWSTALAGLLPDSDVSENCQGPAFGPVELLHDGPGGSDVEVPAMYPLDACGDKEPIAHSVRAIIAAGVTLGGAWRMWDMFTGSLGAYRGGGRHMSEKEWV